MLVPNERGLDRALAKGVREIAIFGSATETFAQRNLNRSVDESIAMFAPVVERARAEGLAVRAYVSMCFGDPWEGEVPIEQVVDVGSQAARPRLHASCPSATRSASATAGPRHRAARGVRRRRRRYRPAGRALPRHLRAGAGQHLAALEAGITTVDASAGGLGGCPYAKNATGNLATEDLVWMLDGLGIDTGVDLGKLVETSLWMAAQLGRPSPSNVVRALSS